MSITGPGITENYVVVNERVNFAADLLCELHRRQWSPKHIGRVTKAIVGIEAVPPKPAEQEKEACRSGQSASSASHSSSSQSSPTTPSSSGVVAPSEPLRWGCRVAKMPLMNYDIQSPCGGFWYHPCIGRWAEYARFTEKFGSFTSDTEALAALNHPNTPPPPSWKEPSCQTTKSPPSSSSPSASASSPAPSSSRGEKIPGLRTTGEVARSIRNEMYTNTTNPYRKDGVERIVTDVRVAVASHIKTKLLEQFGMPDTRDLIDDILSDIISELKGQA